MHEKLKEEKIVSTHINLKGIRFIHHGLKIHSLTTMSNKIYIQINTVVKEDRLYMLQQLLKNTITLPGDVAECGVYKGGTAYLLADIIQVEKANKNLLLFDTFAGMPNEAEEDESGHKKGDFGDVKLKNVQKQLSGFPFIQYFKGYIPETFSDVTTNEFCFVHVDVDLYLAVKNCCNFFYDKMVKGGVFIFDDYGFKKYEKTGKKAVDEFFYNKPEVVISLPTGQSFVIKQ